MKRKNIFFKKKYIAFFFKKFFYQNSFFFHFSLKSLPTSFFFFKVKKKFLFFLKICLFLKRSNLLKNLNRRKKSTYQLIFKKINFFFLKKLNSQSFFFFKKYFFLKKKKCILVENSLGQIFFKKSFFGSLLNSIITQLNFFLKSFVLGNTYILQILSPGTMVFNLFNLAVCNGTYIFLKKKVSFKGFFQVILPSGFFKKININSLITLGRNDNIFEKKLIFSSFWAKKKKIRVRGIAKNPVDHPNGGRSNTKQPLKTPWGLIAKKSK